MRGVSTYKRLVREGWGQGGLGQNADAPLGFTLQKRVTYLVWLLHLAFQKVGRGGRWRVKP